MLGDWWEAHQFGVFIVGYLVFVGFVFLFGILALRKR